MEQAVNNINKAIVSALKSSKGEVINVYPMGLAEPVVSRAESGDVTFPAVITPQGECFDVYGLCDTHDLSFYHKQTGLSYQENQSSSYGNRRTYASVADISLVVYGRRLLYNKYALENLICGVLASSANVVLVGADINGIDILSSEYGGMPYFLDPRFFIFRINYRLTGTLNTACIKH